MNTISLEATMQVVCSKVDYHAACLKNGFRVPNIDSKLSTLEFLQEVRLGKVYVPKYVDLKVSPCPYPPTIQDVQEELVKLIESNIHLIAQAQQTPYVKLAEHLKLRAGDKAFMLDVISTLTDRNHQYFNKDYLPPKKQTIRTNYQVDNSDSFFTGLPISKKQKGKRANMSMYVTEQEIVEAKLAKVNEQLRLLNIKADTLRGNGNQVGAQMQNINNQQNQHVIQANIVPTNLNQQFQRVQVSGKQLDVDVDVNEDEFKKTIDSYSNQYDFTPPEKLTKSKIVPYMTKQIYANSGPNFIGTMDEDISE